MKPIRKKPLAFVGAAAAAAAAVFLLFSRQQPEESFSEFCDTLFCEELSANTLNLHFTLKDPAAAGILDYEVTLGEWSAEPDNSQLLALSETLRSFEGKTADDTERTTLLLLSDYVERLLAVSEFAYYEEPLTPSNGATSQLPVLLAEYTFSDSTDVEDYLTLLSQMDDYFAGILEYEQAKADAGLFMSDRACEKVIESCEAFTAHATDNFLLDTFSARLDAADAFTDRQKEAYIAENEAVIAEHVIPAYEQMADGLTQLLGRGQNDWGLCYTADGTAYYEALVAADTGCDDGAEALFTLIADARAEDLDACTTLLAQEPSLITETPTLPDALSDEAAMVSALQSAIQEDFPEAPAVSCEIAQVNEALSDFLAPAFYITAPIDDWSHNTIYLNSANSYSDIYLFTTLAHEGYPGHLYQTVCTAEYGAPMVRALLNYPGYTEGWATYVEMLAFSYAGLDENLAALLSHNQAMILSLYATTDIGIHYYGWKTEEIEEFWGTYGIDDADTVGDITELVLEQPANYLRYYVGYLKFRQLRTEMENALGDEFDAKAFHAAILCTGPSSFEILEDEVRVQLLPASGK